MCWEIDFPIAGILPQATTGTGSANEDILRELYALFFTLRMNVFQRIGNME